MTLRHPRIYTQRDLERIEALKRLPDEQRLAMRVVASVLPFRVNDYVIDELIDWNNIPEDPIFQLTFPQRGMLAPAPFERMTRLHRSGAHEATISALATEIRAALNPHPGGQMDLNVPRGQAGDKLSGLQHKYRESVLVFPLRGRPAMRIAPTVSDGHSSSATRRCAYPPARGRLCVITSSATPR
jgi:hypothetical protein